MQTKYKLLRIRDLIGFNGQLNCDKGFITEIIFGFDTEKKYDEKNACMQRGKQKLGNIFVKSKKSY